MLHFSTHNSVLIKGLVIGPRVSVNAVLASLRAGYDIYFYWSGEKYKPSFGLSGRTDRYSAVIKNIPGAYKKCAALITSNRALSAEPDGVTFIEDVVGAPRPTDNAVIEIYNRISQTLAVPIKRDWALALMIRGFQENRIAACNSSGFHFWALDLNEEWWAKTITQMVKAGELKV